MGESTAEVIDRETGVCEALVEMLDHRRSR
jgi:hypothetical protein